MRPGHKTKSKGIFGHATDTETTKMVTGYFQVFAKDTVKMMDDPDNLLASLHDYFSKWQLQRAGQTAAKLVSVTSSFVSATSLDPAFSRMRGANLDDRTIAERLNQNGNDFGKIIADFKNYQDVSADETRLMEDVFGHCMQIMNDRIKALKICKNKIYNIYSDHENTLRSFIETNQTLSTSQNRL